MSKETRAAVLNEAFDRLEEDDIEGLMEVVYQAVDPEVVFVSGLDTQIDGREYVGFEGLREYFAELIATVGVTYLNREFQAVGSDHMLYTCDLEMVGRTSGTRMRQPIGQVYEYEEGLIRRLWSYTSQADARAQLAERTHA